MPARGDRFVVLVLGTRVDEATGALQRLRLLVPTLYQALNVALLWGNPLSLTLP
jgi:hypothetical protein